MKFEIAYMLVNTALLLCVIFTFVFWPEKAVPVVVCELVDGGHTCALLTPAGETLVLK